MGLMLAAVVAGVLLLGLPKLPLAVSLLSYFVLFLVMELTILHRRTSAAARAAAAMSALLLALLLQARPPTGRGRAEPRAAAPRAAATRRPRRGGTRPEPRREAEAGHEDPSTVIMHHVTDVPLRSGRSSCPRSTSSSSCSRPRS